MKTTTDHNEIRRWVESRGGRPAIVPSAREHNDAEGLQIDFPDLERAGLEPIPWETWFRAFEDKQLAFLFDENSSTNDHPSCTLVSRIGA